jgi:uncharacterized OB-fold protein
MAQSLAEQYLQHLAQGRFMIQRERASGKCFFYPRRLAPVSGSTDIEWIEAGGGGTVYSTTVIRQKPPQPDYNLALIDLDEGPRMLSRVEGVPAAEVRIGLRVQARIIEDDGQPLVVFTPRAPGGQS